MSQPTDPLVPSTPPTQYPPSPQFAATQYAPPPPVAHAAPPSYPAPPVQYVPAPGAYPPQYARAPQPQVPGAVVCRICGGAPAIKGTARGHRGMIVVMQFRSIKGPFCRDCGIASVRKLSADTLWQGWWGYFSSVATPVVLLINLVLRLRLGGLPEPAGGARPPLEGGKPLYLRPAILGLLAPIGIIVLIVWAISTS